MEGGAELLGLFFWKLQWRDLTRAVMKALGATSHAKGARRGVLIAASDERQLYDRLGWELHFFDLKTESTAIN